MYIDSNWGIKNVKVTKSTTAKNIIIKTGYYNADFTFRWVSSTDSKYFANSSNVSDNLPLTSPALTNDIYNWNNLMEPTVSVLISSYNSYFTLHCYS